MSAPIKKERLKTVQSTLNIYFTGIRCGELVCRPHTVSTSLPPAMFDASDISLAQCALLVLTGGKRYTAVDNLQVDEETVELEMIEPHR